MKYDFNTNRMENKIQINIDKWLYPLQTFLEIHNINGKTHVTYITEVEFAGSNNLQINTFSIFYMWGLHTGCKP